MFKSSTLLNSLFMPTSLALAMTLVGCTDKPAESNETVEVGTEAGSTDTANTTEFSTENDTSGSTLADVQELTVNNGSEPESLDPHKISGVTESNIIRQMIVGLASTDPDGNTIPGMAESWDSPDNKVWTFKIRDANWSNGDPVTAEDFVYGLRRIVDPETAAPYSSYLADAKVVNAAEVIEGTVAPEELGVKAIDDKTLEITLSEPVPWFPDMLIHTSTYPVHKATVEEFAEKWTQPENIVVNGAYKISDWKVNDKIILERNPTYYDNDNTTIEKITMLAINDQASALKRYEADELDTAGFPTEQFEPLREKYPDEMKISPSLCTYYYEFNTEKAPFDDVRVRRALALALDRSVITDKILKMGQTPAYQFTPPSTQAMGTVSPEWSTKDRAAKVEEAKSLLAEAGFDESNPLEFELLYNTSESHKQLAAAASSLWKEGLGNVDVTLTNQEWKTYLDTKRNGDFEVARAGWCGDYNEPSTFLNILKSGNSNNTGKYSSEEFDSIMAKTLEPGLTPEQRADLYEEAEVVLDKDMPLVNVYHYVGANLVKPWLMNWSLKDPLANRQYKDVSIAEH